MLELNQISFIELFAGIGGFRYGLESIDGSKDGKGQENSQENAEKRQGLESQAREETHTQTGQYNEQFDSNTNSRAFTCIWANEIDKYACKIYRKNFGKRELTEGDITTVDADEIPDHDLLTAGFPCQAFSIAGKRKGFDDTRGTLFFEIGRVLQYKKPRYFILENVGGLLSHDKGRTFEVIIISLNELGYDIQWQMHNSKNWVPQNRERMFIIGHLGGTRRPEVFPFRENNCQINDVQGQVANTLRARYEGAQATGTYIGEDKFNAQGEIDIIAHRKNYRRNMQVFNPDGITEALDTGQSGGRGQHTVQNMRIRRLTPVECERLQGFPDNWTEGVSDTQRYKMLGNAVTTNVITEIGKRLLNTYRLELIK